MVSDGEEHTSLLNGPIKASKHSAWWVCPRRKVEPLCDESGWVHSKTTCGLRGHYLHTQLYLLSGSQTIYLNYACAGTFLSGTMINAIYSKPSQQRSSDPPGSS